MPPKNERTPGRQPRRARRGQRRPRQRGGEERRLPERCRIEGDEVVFGEKVDELAVRQFVPLLRRARQEGAGGFTLNFYATERAYPEAMLQLIVQVDRLKRQGVHFDALTPENRYLNRLFLNANWAHLLCPFMFEPSDTTSSRHIATRRYRSAEEQKAIVDATLEILLRAMELDRSLLDGLEWSLNEITDNVLNHAEAPDGGVVQVTTLREHDRVKFVVADGGQGIPESMRQGHPELRRDVDAIGEAIKQGVTRSQEVGQGNGLAGALRIATLSGGSFEVLSGCGRLHAAHPPDTPDYKQRVSGRPAREAFRGTCVTVEVNTAAGIDLDEALNFSGGHSGWSFLDAAYVGEGGAIRLPLADETSGFGSRTAGRTLRTKALNLLRADPSAHIVLDWSGVPSISSSFADEFVGRLFVELGPIAFMSRVKSQNVDDLARKLLDRAILQRSAQA